MRGGWGGASGSRSNQLMDCPSQSLTLCKEGSLELSSGAVYTFRAEGGEIKRRIRIANPALSGTAAKNNGGVAGIAPSVTQYVAERESGLSPQLW